MLKHRAARAKQAGKQQAQDKQVLAEQRAEEQRVVQEALEKVRFTALRPCYLFGAAEFDEGWSAVIHPAVGCACRLLLCASPPGAHSRVALRLRCLSSCTECNQQPVVFLAEMEL